MSKSSWLSVLAFAFVLAAQGVVFAQTGSGGISGVVRDEAQAVIPGVEVTVTHVETGRVRTAVTSETGNYNVSNLAVGQYAVRAELPGFRAAVRDGVTLTVGRRIVVDLELQVGSVTEEVTVTGAAPLIETTSATLEGLIDDKQIRDLPLNARSFIDLATMQTGTTFSTGRQSATKGFGKKISVSGQRYNANAFLLDGAVINDATGTQGGASGNMMGVETVREFSVVTDGYSAEFGRHTGGVINAVTKSGTNQIHGSIFEFLRNDNLDAANFFDNRDRGGLQPEFKRHQFGFSLGGPIVKDSTFFFGSYEGLRDRLGQSSSFNVPGAAMRQGIIGGEQFEVDPEIQPYLAAYPSAPNQVERSDGTARATFGRTRKTDADYFTVKVDHSFSDSDSMFVRYTFDDATRIDPQDLITSEDSDTQNQYTTIEHSHIFSPSLVNSAQFSFNRTVLLFFDNPLDGVTFPGGRTSFSDQNDVVGIIQVDGFSAWGGGTTNPKEHFQNNYQFKNDLFLTRDRHSFKFGVQAERLHFNQRSEFNGMGVFSFGSTEDFLLNSPDTFNAIAPGSDVRRGWRTWLIGFYAQDDFKVSDRLTFNLGLRYEFITVPTEVNGKVSNFRNLDGALLSRGSGVLDYDAPFFNFNQNEADIGDPYFENPSLTNIAPRVGFAWDPFGNGATAVRGGFGIFYDQILPNAYITSGVRMVPFFAGTAVDSDDVDVDFPNAFANQVVGSATQASRPRIEAFDANPGQPTVYKWSLNVQQEILPDTVLEVGYAGSDSSDLIRGAIQLNTNPVDFVGGRAFFRIEEPLASSNFDRMRWRVVNGDADYHSLRATVKKRFSQNFQFQSSFTWSHSTDDTSTWTGTSDFDAADQRGIRDLPFRAASGYDVPLVFNTSFTWALPGSNMSGAMGALLGGWQTSGLLRFTDGYPITPVGDHPRFCRTAGEAPEDCRRTRRLIWIDGAELNLVGSDNNPIDSRNPDTYIDVSQFSALSVTGADGTPCPSGGFSDGSPCGVFNGTLGRNTLRVPGVAGVDLSLQKDFGFPALGEEGKVQFRAEFFNLFNRANFGEPENDLFDRRNASTFLSSDGGEIVETATTSRNVQFALKILF